MSIVFADAFYFVARLNGRDQHHERVLAFSRDFRAANTTPAPPVMSAETLAKEFVEQGVEIYAKA